MRRGDARPRRRAPGPNRRPAPGCSTGPRTHGTGGRAPIPRLSAPTPRWAPSSRRSPPPGRPANRPRAWSGGSLDNGCGGRCLPHRSSRKCRSFGTQTLPVRAGRHRPGSNSLGVAKAALSQRPDGVVLGRRVGAPSCVCGRRGRQSRRRCHGGSSSVWVFVQRVWTHDGLGRCRVRIWQDTWRVDRPSIESRPVIWSRAEEH